MPLFGPPWHVFPVAQVPLPQSESVVQSMPSWDESPRHAPARQRGHGWVPGRFCKTSNVRFMAEVSGMFVFIVPLSHRALPPAG